MIEFKSLAFQDSFFLSQLQNSFASPEVLLYREHKIMHIIVQNKNILSDRF